MPTNVSVENNFIGGLKTEFTGLNFPENACTAASNCVFSIIGDVLSREGIDFESSFHLNSITIGSNAVNYYRWVNAGGDGSSQILVVQIGDILYFFFTSQATANSPISAQLLTPTVNITNYLPQGSANDPSQIECQFSDGNGYLFVFHPMLDPFFVQFTSVGPSLLASRINVIVRDFAGVTPEPGNPAVTFRPTMLTNEHNYNLQNQGWTNASTWTTSSTTPNLVQFGNNISLLNNNVPASETFTVASGLMVTPGTQVTINWSCGASVQSPGDGIFFVPITGTAVGNVTSYVGTTMVINVTSSTIYNPSPGTFASGPVNQSFTIASSNLINTINTWHTQIGNYPSNADVWFEFITPDNVTTSSPGTFMPSTMIGVVPLSQAQSAQGHFLLSAFNQDRTAVSGIPNLTPITTKKRPRTGCWFQGRVWYAGVDDSQPSSGDMPFYTWTENIYFSQIVSSTQDFGSCFQQNDPTDNKLFDLLPDDGGVLVIQGSGPIYKLFPIQNGLLVFAANGVWLIRGNTGLGFTANDFSVNQLPNSVKSIASTSFVNVNGLPFFWNHEGIYRVAPTQQGAPYGFGGLEVEPLTIGTILSFYNNIPFDSKRFVRGYYDPVSYIITWVYRSTQESGIANRYQYDSALSINVINRAFYPYTFGNNNNVTVNGIVYIDYPTGGLNPTFKYLVSTPTQLTFAEEKDSTNWVDWFSFDNVGAPYTSSFTTGYKVHGQGFRKFQPIYVHMFSNSSLSTRYNIQGVWDYATSTNSNKISSKQVAISPETGNFGFVRRRHKIRGHGDILQLQVSSVTGFPFHIIGWAIPEQVNVSA